MAHSNARQSTATDDETQGTLPPGPTHIAARSNRTPEQVESNRVFMAAAGRVEFGRHENTRRAVFMAFAYFGSFGPERVCYATVEHVAERAKVSARTVQRHSPALVSRALISAPTRAGGHVPTVWKILVSEPAPIERGLTLCRPRGDSVSPNIRDRGSSSGPRPKGASAPQKRDGKNCGSGPVTTAAAWKASPVPFVLLATAEQAQPHVEAMRRIAQKAATRTPTITNDDDRAHGHQPTHSEEQEAIFQEHDRQLQQQRQAAFTPTADHLTESCPHDRIIGGSCHTCGYDDGTGPVPSADHNNGH